MMKDVRKNAGESSVKNSPANNKKWCFIALLICRGIISLLFCNYVWIFLKMTPDKNTMKDQELDMPRVHKTPSKQQQEDKRRVLHKTPPKQWAINSQGEPLNIVILYPDDWRHDDLGDTNPLLKTPFFSQLASEGIRFTQNAVTTSICWISRATLFTGQYVNKHISVNLRLPWFTKVKERWEKTWPYLLQTKAGYWVGHVGKWQFSLQEQNVAYGSSTLFNYSHFVEGWHMRGGQNIATVAKDATIKFLRARPKDKPFAVTVAFYPPKGIADPKEVDAEHLKMYENVTIPEPYHNISRPEALKMLPEFLQPNKTEARKRYNYRYVDVIGYQKAMRSYYATVSYLDKMCSEIIDELKNQNIYQKTMIIVTADNGEFHTNHALADKWYPYQESIRVPLIIYDPRIPLHKRGTLDHSFTLNVDLATTILGAAGLQPPKDMQGQNIAELYLSNDDDINEDYDQEKKELLDTNNNAKTTIYSLFNTKASKNKRETKPDKKKIRTKQHWRTEFFYEFPAIQWNIPSSRSLVRKDYKYITWPKNGAYEELFDLKNDPFEFHNLASNSKYQNLKNAMRIRMEELRYDVMYPNIPDTSCDSIIGDKNLPVCSVTITNASSLPVCCS